MERLVLPVLGNVQVSPLVRQIAALPEIQRLRHVSLSNIDSCTLAAIGGVSRYEHSIGTAILAEELAKRLALDDEFHAELVLAAGLHDVTAPGLGHLFEEGCSMVDMPFDHEQRIGTIFLDEGDEYFQAYLGRELGCRKLMANTGTKPESVFAALVGQGRCGKAISGPMDVDNIDNVARMLSRLGHVLDRRTMIDFTEVFRLSQGTIELDPERQDLFNKWLSLRIELYNTLMLEMSDFAAKTMMKLAIATGLKEGAIRVEDWRLTDYELLHKLRDSPATKDIIERLWLGDYFRVVAMYWVEGAESLSLLRDNARRGLFQQAVRAALGPAMYVDFIPDKRNREMSGRARCKRALLGITCQSKSQRRSELRACHDLVRAHMTVTEVVFPKAPGSQNLAPQLPF